MRFSLPYVVAMAAAKQKVGPAEIDLKYAEDTKMQALMDKIQCVEDDSKRNPGFFPGYLTVDFDALHDGSGPLMVRLLKERAYDKDPVFDPNRMLFANEFGPESTRKVANDFSEV